MKLFNRKAGAAFRSGAVSLAFLIIGYETALFVHRAARLSIAAAADKPDTVYVIDTSLSGRLLREQDSPLPARTSQGAVTVRREAAHSPEVKAVRRSERRVENFRFDPNTVSVEDLRRLGFSEKQAASIDAYRKKGGRFRRKADFAKSYVVSDSVFRRLEPFIDIPLIDINSADSTAFDSLPGIGGWFASKMVSYREQLGGYSCPEQLMEIYRFDREKYDGLKDLISCSPPRKRFALWSLPVDSLRLHPYIRDYQTARAIVLYREHNPREKWTTAGLESAGIIDSLTAYRLSRCAVETP